MTMSFLPPYNISEWFSGADPGLTVGGAKYTARISAREILCATPTFDVIFKVIA